MKASQFRPSESPAPRSARSSAAATRSSPVARLVLGNRQPLLPAAGGSGDGALRVKASATCQYGMGREMAPLPELPQSFSKRRLTASHLLSARVLRHNLAPDGVPASFGELAAASSFHRNPITGSVNPARPSDTHTAQNSSHIDFGGNESWQQNRWSLTTKLGSRWPPA